MAEVLRTLLVQVHGNEALRSLLVSSEHEDQRPRLRIDGKEYIVGLVDDHPMLLGEKDRMLFNPEMIGDESVTEIVWKLR